MIINNEIEIQVPDDLKVMSEEKRKAMNFLADGEGYCLENEDKHILISIGWKKVGLFAGAMLNTNDLYKGMEKSIQTGMQPYNYNKERDLEKNIDGETIKGIRYKYTATEIDMIGESYVVKKGKNIYYFHYYSREELDNDNKNIWSNILESAKWI